MSAVTLQFSTATEQKLRDQASRAGQTLETYLERLAEQAVNNGAHSASVNGSPTRPVDSKGNVLSNGSDEQPKYLSEPRLANTEFERLLHNLATGPRLPVLPPDFSRGDIYNDHD
jgi:hypothetical protein